MNSIVNDIYPSFEGISWLLQLSNPNDVTLNTIKYISTLIALKAKIKELTLKKWINNKNENNTRNDSITELKLLFASKLKKYLKIFYKNKIILLEDEFKQFTIKRHKTISEKMQNIKESESSHSIDNLETKNKEKE